MLKALDGTETTIGIAYFTERGGVLAQRIADGLGNSCQILWYKKGLKDWCRGCFAQAQALIFIGASGIAVRTIAPFLKSKTEDPAVLVMDEAGRYVISLLSGHIGGANEFALRIAEITGAAPVITTASDVRGKIAVDVFAKKNQLTIADMKDAKKVEAAILRGETVGLVCSGEIDGDAPNELTIVPYEAVCLSDEERSMIGWEESTADPEWKCRENNKQTVTNNQSEKEKQPCSLIWICEHVITDEEQERCVRLLRTMRPEKQADDEEGSRSRQEEITDVKRGQSRQEETADAVLHLIPQSVVLGIGCRRGKEKAAIEYAVDKILSEQGIPWEAVQSAASIDLKKDEEGLVSFCREREIPFVTFSSEELLAVPGEFAASEFVRKTTGVDNVCERSALAQAGANGKIIRKKYAENGVTVAVAVREWRIRFGK